MVEKSKKKKTKRKKLDPRDKLKKPGDGVIYKAKYYYIGEDQQMYGLSFREKKFVEAYLKFGAKGPDAVYEAGYKPKNVRIASGIAYENLTKPHIFNYVHLLLDEYGFNDDNVSKEHFFLLKQDGDLKSKSKAVDMYYKLKGQYAPSKIEDVTDPYKDIRALSTEDLLEQRKKLIAFFRKQE